MRLGRAVEIQPVAIVPDLDIEDAVELKWNSQAGVTYRIQYSPDATSLFDIGGVLQGSRNEMRSLQSITNRQKLFRVRVSSP